ncbi:uncharacterized protein LOC126884326 [Diabrotica virgifera virgifera]|uniref:Tc1-like transposase DDE domain-containing protein n=1 Tax=Diabrotica virgifera virgifera TaxID=50390 RepID=A0ABM5K7Q5_DIAVI|nr:uncharacterized protein LOC126884326 [Diabrotica virgifera virgifera]
MDEIQISVAALRVLKELKFRWVNCSFSNRKYLMEQPNVTLKRLQFLKAYKENQNSVCPLKPVFLDETWICRKGGFRKSWQDGSSYAVRKKIGEGVRYIVLHAGSENGFIENGELIFKSGSKSGDYHDSMNSNNFGKWFEHHLLPNLEEPSLIIMDNASHHSTVVEKIPNASWAKHSLIEWLTNRHISCSISMMKFELMDILKKNLPDKVFKLDRLALQYAHRVLRLPPYHCQFNPIDNVWSDCKRYYDANITSSGVTNEATVINVWKKSLQQVTPEKWRKYVRHAEKLIDEYWETAKRINTSHISPIIIDLKESDSDSSDDDFVEMSEKN